MVAGTTTGGGCWGRMGSGWGVAALAKGVLKAGAALHGQHELKQAAVNHLEMSQLLPQQHLRVCC